MISAYFLNKDYSLDGCINFEVYSLLSLRIYERQKVYDKKDDRYYIKTTAGVCRGRQVNQLLVRVCLTSYFGRENVLTEAIAYTL